ncbi:MAG: hypothetical protein JXR68_13085 [Bacteroidales bacterium]|nr:hypothetical protein [Bacteroidales bacterium]
MVNKKPAFPLYLEKWRLAKLMGVSDTTLRNMLNKNYFDELKKIGYVKTQKYLNQKQLAHIFPMGLNFEFDT